MPFNVGIIGYGFSAKIFHIPFIQQVPDLKLYAVVQRNPTPDNDVEKDHPAVKSFRGTEDMVRDDAVDIVVITTAPDSHYQLARLALENGKHVLCEKPFTPTYKEAVELNTLAKATGKLLAVYQNRRWDADFLTLQNLHVSGTLGRLVDLQSYFDRHRPHEPSPSVSKWKNRLIPGGGAIYDLGTHLIDQAVCLLGIPQRITAFVGSQRAVNESGFDDSFTVLLHYADGTMATLRAGVVSPEEKQLRFWARGENGSFKKFYVDVQEEQLKDGMRPADNGFGRESNDRYGILTTIQNGAPVGSVHPTVEPATWTEYYRKLAKALAGQDELPVSGTEAAEVIRLIELAKESSRQGRTIDV